MQQRVVFLCYHAFGHINAYLGIASTIKQHGGEAIFAGVGYFQTYVLQQGFSYYVLEAYPFGLGLETWKNTIEKKKYVYLSSLTDRVKDRLATEREADLYWLLESIKPDTVLLDAFQATDFILLYPQLKKRNIKFAILNATPPTAVDNMHPPLNSDALPHETDEVKAAIATLRWQQFWKKIKKKIKNAGFSDDYIIRRKLKASQIPSQYISKKQNLLNFAVGNVDQFILIPKEFDFSSDRPDALEKYIGFQPTEIRIDYTSVEYNEKALEIQRWKNKNAKFVYCSFGTIEVKNKKIILAFLEKLIQAVQSENNVVLIISLKAQPKDIGKLCLSPSTYVFNSVPQLEVLRLADVFVTHGGINSIKEAVYAAVPMLMIPVHTDYDPKGNAARVAYHGLGRRGDAQGDSTKEIKEKIDDLLKNPIYKLKLKELKAKDERYTPEKFLLHVKGLKSLS